MKTLVASRGRQASLSQERRSAGGVSVCGSLTALVGGPLFPDWPTQGPPSSGPRAAAPTLPAPSLGFLTALQRKDLHKAASLA